MTPNYIFDFGKVLVEFEPLYMSSQYISDPEDIKLASEVIFDRLYWDKLDHGTITDEEVKESIHKRLPERLWKNADKIYDNWYRHLPEIEGMRSILMRLKNEGHRLYLLSNISISFAENYCQIPALKELFSFFDGLVFSGPIGLVKPSSEIFYHLLEKYHLKAEECTFIDDSVINVTGARNVGIHAIQFDGNAQNLVNEIFKRN